MHFGFWHFRLQGTYSHRYWPHTYFAKETLVPDWARNLEKHTLEYNREWDAIDLQTKPLLSEPDRARLEIMSGHPELFATYNSTYTLARERLLKQAVLRHIAEAPGYYLTTRLYTAMRLFIPDVNEKLLSSGTVRGFAMGTYPTLVNVCTFIPGLLLIAYALRQGLMPLNTWAPAVGIASYYWLIHIRMVVQSRYLVPAYPIIFMLIAVAAERIACTTRNDNSRLPADRSLGIHV